MCSVYFSTASTAVMCMISGFLCKIHEDCTLLGYYAVSGGNFSLTFWDNLKVPSSGVKNPFLFLSRNIGKKLPLLAA